MNVKRIKMQMIFAHCYKEYNSRDKKKIGQNIQDAMHRYHSYLDHGLNIYIQIRDDIILYNFVYIMKWKKIFKFFLFFLFYINRKIIINSNFDQRICFNYIN